MALYHSWKYENTNNQVAKTIKLRVYTKAPKSTKNYYSNNRQNKNLLFDRFCRLFDFVDYDYLSNNRQKMELYIFGLV